MPQGPCCIRSRHTTEREGGQSGDGLAPTPREPHIPPMASRIVTYVHRPKRKAKRKKQAAMPAGTPVIVTAPKPKKLEALRRWRRLTGKDE